MAKLFITLEVDIPIEPVILTPAHGYAIANYILDRVSGYDVPMEYLMRNSRTTIKNIQDSDNKLTFNINLH